MTTINPEDLILSRIEHSLLDNLRPVEPTPEFAMRLQRRLNASSHVTLEAPYNWALALVAAGLGLFLGATILWLLRRAPTRSSA
jgi:hypothetical protein